jgi:hypothetical protein
MMKTMMKIMMAVAAFALVVGAHAQIGWTLDQCRKHWGQESITIYHGEALTGEPLTTTIYSFDSGSKIEKEVTFDAQGKVNDVFYIGATAADADWVPMLKIPKLLANQKGIIWRIDPDNPPTGRHAYWLGFKGDVVVFHARYFYGKRDVNGDTWGESLEVLSIGKWILREGPPIDALPPRIEVEKKAKAAAGPTKEELESAAHDAEIRANNERALKAASNGQ